MGLSIFLAGCYGDKAMVYKPNPETGKYETYYMTDFEVFQMHEESHFQDELQGKPPWNGFTTWEAYWNWRYKLIRENSKIYEKKIN